ncbi:MAG: hypothetical protein JWP41_4488 [Ramlibacter sp.]|jgi:hypothetical protein|nr:hypothetical protein [Ramlibacter sp.]
MTTTSRSILAACIGAAFAAGAAHAQGAPGVKFSGFGTLAATYSDERNADFVTNLLQPNGAGATRPWSMTPDSKLGGQLDATFTERLTGTLQLVSQQRADNRWVPEFQVASVKYQATPDLSVRVGRIALPFFLYSDTRLVGYAQPWLRPPVEAYIINPNTYNDGVDVMYRTRWGSFTHNLQAFYGANKTKQPNGTLSRSNPNIGLNDTVQTGDLTLRAAYTYSKVEIGGLVGLAQGFTAFSTVPGPAGAEAARLARSYTGRDMDFGTLALAASYDPGRWFVTGEYLDFRGEGLVQGSRSWYVTGGYRMGTWTPYVTYAGSKNRTRNESGIPFAPAAGLNAALQDILGNPQKQNTLSLGLRWDFAPNMDLKAQYDRIELGANAQGRLINPRPGFVRGGNVNVFAVSYDFVF